MAKRNYFKRVLAGTLAVLTVAVYLPANVGTGGLFGQTAIIASAADTAYVSTADELTAALSNSEVSKIVFKNSITYSVILSIGRNVEIDLNGKTLESSRYVEFSSSCTVSFQNGNITGGMGAGFFYTSSSVTLTLTNLNIVVNSYAVSNLKSGSILNLNNVYTNGKSILHPYAVNGVTVNGSTVDSPIQFTKNISEENVTATASTYTSSALTPEIKVDDTTLTENTDYTYTVTDSKNNPVDSVVNAGTYHVTVTAVENSDYTGSKTVDWTVNKADPTASLFTFTAPENLYYDSNAKTATITVNDGVEGMGNVTVHYLLDGHDEEPKEAGTYTVVATVAEGTNYNATAVGNYLSDENWNFTINYKPTNLTLSNLGDTVVTTTDGTEITNTSALIQGTYYIYTNKSIADSDATDALSMGYKKNQTYNGTKYQYRYEIEVPEIPADGYVLSHTNNWVGKVETTDISALLIGEDGVFDNTGAVLKGEGTYYYGDQPTAESVQITEGFENGIVSVGEVYFAQANGAKVDAPEIGKTYYLTAEVFVDKSAEAEEPNNDVSVFYLKQTVNYEKRPLADCEVYLKNGETETPLTVKNNAVTVPASTFTYNKEAQKPEIVIKNNVLGTETTLTSSDYTDTLEAQTNAGKYSATFTAVDNANYTGSLTVNWSIAKAKADIKVTPVETIIYDGAPLDETDFIFEGENADLVNDKETYPNTVVTISGQDITNAGETTANIKMTFDNYKDITLSVDAVIQKRSVKVAPADGQSIIYGTEEKPVISVTTEKALDENGDNVWDTKTGVIPADIETVDFAPTVSIKDFDYTYFKNNANTYEYQISDYVLDNYTATLDGTAVFTVEPKELTKDMFTVELEDADYTFDGTKKLAPQYTFFDGKYKDRYKTAKLTADDFAAGGTDHAVLPGTYTLEFSGKNNYTGFVSFDWEIKSIQDYSIFASVDSKIYDGKAVIPSSYLYETADNDKTPVTTIKGVKTTYTYYAVNDGELTKLDGAPKDAGSYRVEVSKTAKGYTFDNYYVDFTIYQKEIVITPNETEKIFGEADPVLANYSYDESAVIEGETPEITGEYALDGYEGNVGSYAFGLGTITIDSDNYYLTIGGNYVVKVQELTDDNITIFKECIISDDGWSHPGDCIRVTGIVNGEEIELIRPVYDENTGEYINTDFEFISATKTKNIGEFSVQIQGIGNYTGFAEAIVDVRPTNGRNRTVSDDSTVVDVQNDNHSVTVQNGTFSDGSTSAYFADGAVIAVTADKPEDGYKFAYWKKNGSTISYNPTYTFPVTADNITLEAVYVEDTDDIERYGNALIDSITPDKENNKIQFVSMVNVPEDCTILKAGIVATSDETKAQTLTDENAEYVRYDENLTVHNFKYTWTKSSINDDTWYVKGYLVYQDKNGNVKTVYSDLAKATLDGYETIKEDKILGTAVMDSVIPDPEEKKIDFVAMLNVPADCTIKQAGVVSTSDAEKAQNLTAENADYVRADATTKHSYKYTWTKTNVNETWYVRPYLVYTNADGKTFTVYGELATGTLN